MNPVMASSPPTNSITTKNHLRHVESMKILPSGAGQIPHLNAVILGESLAPEENDLVYPSDDFCSGALVPAPEKVCLLRTGNGMWIFAGLALYC